MTTRSLPASVTSGLKSGIKRAVGPKVANLRHITGAPLAFRPGHYYSPICAPEEVRQRYQPPEALRDQAPPAGIALNDAEQRALWAAWKPILDDLPFGPEPRDGLRYYSDNRFFAAGDGTVLTAMIRHHQPRRIVEVGSGFSTACMLDTIDRNIDGPITLTCIEPNPERLYELIGDDVADRVTVIERGVQDVDLALFTALEADDILFIDSTHIVKTGSDVVHELFEVLPSLKPGVLIHLHDIHYPFEYPAEWVIERNYSWNETYAVRAFLMYNSEFEIVFFNDYFAHAASDLILRDAPHMAYNPGGGLWLRRRG